MSWLRKRPRPLVEGELYVVKAQLPLMAPDDTPPDEILVYDEHRLCMSEQRVPAEIITAIRETPDWGGKKAFFRAVYLGPEATPPWELKYRVGNLLW